MPHVLICGKGGALILKMEAIISIFYRLFFPISVSYGYIIIVMVQMIN